MCHYGALTNLFYFLPRVFASLPKFDKFECQSNMVIEAIWSFIVAYVRYTYIKALLKMLQI